MKIKTLLLLPLMLIGTSLWCQQNQRPAGLVAPFLQVSPDAREIAMGNTGVAAKPNVFSMYYNPARYSYIEDITTIGAGIRHCSMSYNLYDFYAAQKIGKTATIAASFRYCLYKEIDYRDESNVSLGTYKPKEYAIDLAYSIKLGEHFSAALAGRYINSALYKSLDSFYKLRNVKPAQTYAFDGGVFYTHNMNFKEFTGNYSLGLSLTNLGGKTGYLKEHTYYDGFDLVVNKDDIDYLPTTVRIGGSADLSKGKNSFALNFDLSKIVVPEFSTFDLNCGFGLEYGRTIKDYSLFARAGYFNNPSVVGNINYYTMGVGLKVFGFNLDLACYVSSNKAKFYENFIASLKYGF